MFFRIFNGIFIGFLSLHWKLFFFLMEFNGFWLNLWRDLYRLAKLVGITDLFQFILFQFIRVRGYMVKKPKTYGKLVFFCWLAGGSFLVYTNVWGLVAPCRKSKTHIFCIEVPCWPIPGFVWVDPSETLTHVLLEDVVWKKNNIWIYEFETLPVEWNLGDFGLVSMDFGPTVDCARPRLVLASWVFGKKCDLRRAAIPSCSGWSHQLFWLNNTLFFG